MATPQHVGTYVRGKMRRLSMVISFLFLAFANAVGQEMPEVKFNHLSFVLESREMKALRESRFVTDTLVAFETRTTKVNGQASSTTAFLYGNSNYLEFFETSGDDPNLGFLTIVFSVDKTSEFKRLQSVLDNTYQTGITPREKIVDGATIPWYDALRVVDTTIVDSAFMEQCHFWFWIMMYKTEYFKVNKMTIDNDELTRENYLEKYAAERKNKIVKRFSGIVMKLNPDEKEYITKFFENIAYKKISGNEYLSPEHFTYFIKERRPGDQNSIESIHFETSESFASKKTVDISGNIVIVIERDEGRIIFKSATDKK